MLTLADITGFFPSMVHTRTRGMLREYLQYLILSSIYTSRYRNKLVFLWGTCLRIAYASQRFSEDLDFDNRGMTESDFTDLGEIIARDLGKYGIDAEIKMAFKWAFHCYVRMPRILFEYGISGYEDEKILIQIDTVPQPIPYESTPFALGNFAIRETISVTPREILLAQKITAAYSRKRTQGRDFYDIQYLLGWRVKPSFLYLQATLWVATPEALRDFMKVKNTSIDFSSLTHDLEPFLFQENDGRMVREFPNMVEQMVFE